MGVLTILESLVHTPEVAVAAITGLLSLTGIILSNVASNRKIEHKLETAQEVTNNEIKHLTEEVKKHNGFAERVPAMETKIENIEHRIDRLETR